MTDIGIPVKVEYAGTDPVGFREISIAGKAGHIFKVNNTETSMEYMTIDSPKRTLFLSGAGGWTSETSGSGGSLQIETVTNNVNIKGILFAASEASAYHEYALAMPENWDEGTITYKPYFMTENVSDVGNITFGLAGRSFNHNDNLDQAYGSSVTTVTSVSSDISGKLIIGNESSDVTIAGEGKFLQLRIFRDGADTFAGDIILLGIRISYTTDGYSDE